MRQGMIQWGAVEMECPKCHQQTPVYPSTIFGGNKSVGCLSCHTSLQYKDGKAVIAEYGTATKEEIMKADEVGLHSIAQIAHYNLGIAKHELHHSLRDQLPKETIWERIRRAIK